MSGRHERFDRKRLKPVSVDRVKHKVRIEQFGKPSEAGSTVGDLLGSLPDIFAAGDLREIIRSVASARRAGAPVLFLFGAHVIKVGLAPVMTPLIRDGIITGLATNGAGVIHDWEIAHFGSTSENVGANLEDGVFGMAGETARGIHTALESGVSHGLGAGEAIGKAIVESGAPHRDKSFFAAAYESRIPITVHIGIGTDIIHMHEEASGSVLGEASHRDFLTLVAQFETMTEESVLLHAGSAVMLPEVALKAVAMLRNAGAPPANYLAVNFDFHQSYRPLQNVLSRPTGRGIHLTGHHEIMLPLLAAGIREELSRDPKS